ncbi:MULTISPECIES: sensor histidine kinase [unclassified Rhizobium]|uniref:sensor histidine kinase n=1 Tax=unclassified Rhizobium TaxID=2613769 RepID=UPI001AE58C8C|nr:MULTISPECIES: sensor histidine kinase [unclassified Rhizobium]MBP2459721.1 two-component sensor histidine kinase [Rhizobium sp. PvP014]MBP2531079.1 two-component sensor histidine kinase [Rhizobium sp. PvP099]
MDQNTEWTSGQLRRAIKAAGVALWTWNVDTDAFTMDQRGYALWDLEVDGVLSFEDLSAKVHPADRDRVRAAFSATRAVVGPYEIDFRIMSDVEVRWISARGQGSDEDILARQMTGIFLDVTGRKQAEEGHELLAGEMSHRVKNLLAIASGLTQMTSRSSSSIADMTSQLTLRLTALGRAHDLVRPLPGGQGKAALLGDLITILLSPYDETAAFAGRIRVAVPRMGVGEAAATGLSLVIHELATNSLKYGALSVGTGTLGVSGSVEENNLMVTWIEQGGPEVVFPQGPAGYGSRMLDRTMSAHLGGTISYNWTPDGALVTLIIDTSRLAS